MFQQSGGQYQKRPKLLYQRPDADGLRRRAGGDGPVLLPGRSQVVYLDMAFFREMEQRFHAGGDFRARVRHRARDRASCAEPDRHHRKDRRPARAHEQKEYNKVSVRVELQADCFAGVWAHHANGQAFSRSAGRGRGVEGRQCDRRRYVAEAVARRGGAGFIYPRQLGTAY